MNSLSPNRVTALLFLLIIVATSPWTSGCAGNVGSSSPTSSSTSNSGISVTISPTSSASVVSGTLSFTAAVQGTSNKSVTWKASPGTITSAGLYTAPATAGTATVTATSVADASKSASAVVTVTTTSPGSTVTSVTISPASTSAGIGHTVQFAATVQGTASDKTVTWKASLGTITSTGLYTAPAKVGTDTVTATSDVDSTKSASATISVTAAAPANAISLLKFGNAGFGGDDTSVFQTALNSTASSHQVLEIPAGTYNISPITFPANSNVVCDGGVTVDANSGLGGSAMLLNMRANNITLTGAGGSASPTSSTCVFQMPKSYVQSQNDGSQFRHCLGIYGGASNVTVSGIACNQSGGDGLYIREATTVTVSDSVFAGNFRNGGSLTGQTNHTLINNNQFLNQRNLAGAAIADGFDVEPNTPADFVEDFHFTGNILNGNQLDGFCSCISKLNSSSAPVTMTLSKNVANNNDEYGFRLGNGDPTNPSGTITVNDNSTDASGFSGIMFRFNEANGFVTNLDHNTVTNSNRLGADSAYGFRAGVAISGGGGNHSATGNIYFTNTNITSTNGHMEHYFYFNDGSGHGMTKVGFSSPGTLSGATQAPPNGVFQGQTVNTVP
jgi:hypothetical protein